MDFDWFLKKSSCNTDGIGMVCVDFQKEALLEHEVLMHLFNFSIDEKEELEN